MRRIASIAVAGAVVALVVPAAGRVERVAGSGAAEGCQSRACEQRVASQRRAAARASCRRMSCRRRVARSEVRERWRAAVRAYGIGLLRARMQCESGGDGGYRLSTNGNGFWFAHQFEPGAWYGAGGRRRRGRPAGAWTLHPSRLEQDYRAVVWDARHGGDPWPNCP